MRRLPRFLRFPIKFRQGARHTSAGRMPGRHAGWPIRGSLESAGRNARRSSRFERILCLAAPAFQVAQDAIDNARLCNKGDDAHAGAAGAKQGIDLEDLPDQARPRAAGLPGEVGIVPILVGISVGIGRVGFCAGFFDSAPVRVSAVKALAMPPWAWYVCRNPVNPFQRIEHKTGDTGARVRACFQGQVAVIELLERVHGQGGARDIAALGFERGRGGPVHGRSGED